MRSTFPAGNRQSPVNVDPFPAFLTVLLIGIVVEKDPFWIVRNTANDIDLSALLTSDSAILLLENSSGRKYCDRKNIFIG